MSSRGLLAILILSELVVREEGHKATSWVQTADSSSQAEGLVHQAWVEVSALAVGWIRVWEVYQTGSSPWAVQTTYIRNFLAFLAKDAVDLVITRSEGQALALAQAAVVVLEDRWEEAALAADFIREGIIKLKINKLFL